MENLVIATIQKTVVPQFEEQYLKIHTESCADMTHESIIKASSIIGAHEDSFTGLLNSAKSGLKNFNVRTPLYIWELPIDEIPNQIAKVNYHFLRLCNIAAKNSSYTDCLEYMDNIADLLGAIRSQFLLNKMWSTWVLNILPKVAKLLVDFDEITRVPTYKDPYNKYNRRAILEKLMNLMIILRGHFPDDMDINSVFLNEYYDDYKESRSFQLIYLYYGVYAKLK